MVFYYKQEKKNKGENRVGRSMTFGRKLIFYFVRKRKNIQTETSFMEAVCSQTTEFMQRKFRNA